MPLDSKGGFHMNPATAAMHSAAPTPEAQAEHGFSHSEIHHAPGKHKVIMHKQDGSQEDGGEHASVHEAANHIASKVGEGQDADGDNDGSMSAGGDCDDEY